MGATRLRGQEVEVRIVKDGELLDTITAVQNFEFNVRTTTLEADYLGDTTTRMDDIYKGVGGRMELHLENDDFLAFMEAVRDRARRVSPVTFSIVATLSFPNGDMPRVILPDVFFDEKTINVGGRTEYVRLTVPFKCEDFRRVG